MAIKKKILKTITWRITASITTLLILYVLSGQIWIAGTFTLLEVVVKSIIYYLHEIIWDNIKSFEDIE